MPLQIVRNDITKVTADAIVNTANPNPRIGRGTDSAIYTAAGKELLLAEREKIGRIERGDAVATPAFGLNAKYIIHTVGPIWKDGEHGEKETLSSCYEKSLALALELKCKSISFPLISSGVYGFPKDTALEIAFSTISSFLMKHEMKVLLVVFDRHALELSENLLGDIKQYIDDHTVRATAIKEYTDDTRYLPEYIGNDSTAVEYKITQPEGNGGKSKRAFSTPLPHPGKSLKAILDEPGLTFQQKLFELIDKSGMDDVTVYKRANVDRKVFSTIRCHVDYKPKKKTAVALAIALKLDLPAMQDLLARAGFAFSPSDKFDLIIAYCVENKVYDIYKVNTALFDNGQPTLG